MRDYVPTLSYTRTDAERRDPFLSWKRSDEHFFASGACHILAFLFVQLHQHENFRAVLLRPKEGAPGTHVFATDGTWAFDFNGWTSEAELLRATRLSYETAYPGWDFDVVTISDSIEEFARQHNHRTPQNFAFLPWERAYTFIGRFDSSPRAGDRDRGTKPYQ